MSPPVLIAGGGIAGLAAALALAQRGQASCVYERSPVFSELGAGVQLGSNALWVLREWGLLPAVQAIGSAPERLHIRAVAHGRSITRLRLGAAVQQRYGLPYLSVHRGQLHQVLLQAAQAQPLISLHSGANVQGLKQNEGGAELLFAHGAPAVGSAVLACDGVWSRLASQIQPALRPATYSGHMAYRTLLPMKVAQDVAQPLMQNLSQELGLWLGRRAHIVHYPVDAGRQLNVVALLEQAQAPQEQGWNQPIATQAVHAALRTAAGGNLCPALTALLHAAEHWFCWPLYGRNGGRMPLGGWAQGRAALLGDAAHPMLPYLAQGAAMALEDAWVLAQHWQAQDAAASLQRYAHLRQGRCARVVNTAARNGQIFHASAALALGRDAYLRLQNDKPMGLGWLYSWRGA